MTVYPITHLALTRPSSPLCGQPMILRDNKVQHYRQVQPAVPMQVMLLPHLARALHAEVLLRQVRCQRHRVVRGTRHATGVVCCGLTAARAATHSRARFFAILNP